MSHPRQLTALFFLVALAGFAALVTWGVPQILGAYDRLHTFHPWAGWAYIGLLSTVGIIFLALTGRLLWRLSRNSWLKQQRRGVQQLKPSELSTAGKEREINRLFGETSQLLDDDSLSDQLRLPLRDAMAQLQAKLDHQTLEIVAFGSISGGKSSLLNALANRDVFSTDIKGGTTVLRNEIPWPNNSKIILVDTPGLGEVRDLEHQQTARQAARDADLILFVIDGPLKDYEFAVLSDLCELEKTIFICLNKSDWYTAEDLDKLRQQIQEQVSEMAHPPKVISVRSRQTQRERIRVTPDGREEIESVVVEPNISELAEQMLNLVQHDGKELLLANMLLRSRGLVDNAKEQAQRELDRQAKKIVDTYMWQTGAVAAVAPIAIDLAAAFALSTKMVLDLGKVYKQEIDLATARRLITELGKNMVSVLGTSMAAPLAGTAVASVLKSIPGIGTITGGLLQGFVQALITRWIGHIFIDYYRREMRAPPEGWAANAQTKWKQLTQASELADFVRQGMSHFKQSKADDAAKRTDVDER